jgi:hypothetical protein
MIVGVIMENHLVPGDLIIAGSNCPAVVFTYFGQQVVAEAMKEGVKLTALHATDYPHSKYGFISGTTPGLIISRWQ